MRTSELCNPTATEDMEIEKLTPAAPSMSWWRILVHDGLTAALDAPDLGVPGLVAHGLVMLATPVSAAASPKAAAPTPMSAAASPESAVPAPVAATDASEAARAASMAASDLGLRGRRATRVSASLGGRRVATDD